jgi:hypothetical protein
MPDLLTRVSFAPHQNTVFAVTVDGNLPVELELVEVTDKTPTGFRGEQFSLVFGGPSEPVLPQRLYEMEHGILGHLEIFLVPIGLQKDRRLYEAFFNRFEPDHD